MRKTRTAEEKQKNRKPEARRSLWIFSVLTCLVIIILVCIIAEQVSGIQDLDYTLKVERKRIDSHYDEDRRERKNALVQEAFALFEDGDRIMGIRTAYSGFPGPGGESISYMPGLAYALSEGLHIYANGNRILPDRQLKTEKDIKLIRLSPEGSLVLTMDDTYVMRLYSAKDGSLLKKFSGRGWYSSGYGETRYVFLNDTCLFYPTGSGMALYDSEKQTDAYSIGCGGYRRIVLDDKREKMLVIGGSVGEEDVCYMIRTDTGEIQYTVPVPGGYCLNAAFCKEDWFALLIRTETNEFELHIYHADDGRFVRSYPFYGEDVYASMHEADGVLYVIENTYDDLYSEKWQYNVREETTFIYAIDPEKEAVLWMKIISGDWYHEVEISGKEDSEYLVCASYDNVVVLGREDGRIVINKYYFDSDIIKIGNYQNSNVDGNKGYDYVYVVTEDGRWYDLALLGLNVIERRDFPACPSDHVEMFDMAGDYVVTLAPSDNKVTIYQYAIGSRLETFRKTEGYGRYEEGVIDSTGQYLAVTGVSPSGEGAAYQETYLEMYDTISGDMLWSVYLPEYGDESDTVGMSFYPERNAFVLFSQNACFLFDQNTGEKLETYMLPEENSILDEDSFFCADKTGRYVFVQSCNHEEGYSAVYNELLGFDLKEGRLAYRIPSNDGRSWVNTVTVSSSMDYCALLDTEEECLRVYSLSDWQVEDDTGIVLTYAPDNEPEDKPYVEPDCLTKLSLGSDIEYVDSFFFGEDKYGNPELYVDYDGRHEDGVVKVYSFKRNDADPREESGTDISVQPEVHIRRTPERTYQGLDETLRSYAHPKRKGYAAAVGECDYYNHYRNAYLIFNDNTDLLYSGSDSDIAFDLSAPYTMNKEADSQGQIAAHIEGFLALDNTSDRIYLTDGSHIYRVPIYDAGMLAEEAYELLYGNEE